MANEKDSKSKKTPKRATALKRDIQNVRKRGQNRTFKSNVRTTINGFESALKAGSDEAAKALSSIYSMMDRTQCFCRLVRACF